MPITFRQSDLEDLKDQLFLDSSEGEFLDVVAANLGVYRPGIGYSNDDLWRAVTKVLAVDYKQVTTKFRELLSLLFGTQSTEVTTLKESAAVAQDSAILNDVSRLPQKGRLTFDQGLASEETLDYYYIDRKTGTVYLSNAFNFPHTAFVSDYSKGIVSNAVVGTSSVILEDVNQLPTTGFPYTAILDKGLASEEVVSVSAVDSNKRTVTLSSPLTKNHLAMSPTLAKSSLVQGYVPQTNSLVLADTTKFSNSGTIAIQNTSFSFTASGGASTTTATVPGTPFGTDRLSGFLIRFSGNTTAALANVQRTIVSNTNNVITFSPALGVAPAVSDTFLIVPIVSFISNDVTTGTITLSKDISGVPCNSGTVVEQMESRSSLSLAQVQSKGANWGVYQTTKKEVTIVVPTVKQDLRDLRSASYIHNSLITPTPSTVIDFLAGYLTGYTGDIVVQDSTDFPLKGVLVLDPGGPNEEKVFYTKKRISGNSYFTTLLTVVTPFSFDHADSEVVELHQPAYASSDTLEGDVWTAENAFSGPYVYSIFEDAPNTGSLPKTTLAQHVSGPTKVVLDQYTGKTALEVENASAFPLTGFPYSVKVGEGSFSEETVSVSDVSLSSLTKASVTVTNYTAGQTTIRITSLAGSSGIGDNFPLVDGYRVLVGAGTANEEILYVTGFLTGPDRLVVEPGVNNHNVGERVELISDVLSVSPLTKNQGGAITWAQKTSRYPSISSIQRAFSSVVWPLYTQVALTSTAGFPSSGKVLINHATNQIQVKSTTTGTTLLNANSATLASTALFPTANPFLVSFGAGQFGEQVFEVVFNNTGTNTLSFSGETKKSFPAGTIVTYTPGSYEIVDYTSVSGNNLVFSAPIRFSQTHQWDETVYLSVSKSSPESLGYDFPLRTPTDVIFRIRGFFDQIRAAGIRLNFVVGI